MIKIATSKKGLRDLPKGKTGGFTILEILIALALGAVVLSVLYWSYSAVVGSTRRYREVSDFYQTARNSLTNMAREISGAFQPLFAEEELMFRGGDDWFRGMAADSLSFVTSTCLRGREDEVGSDTYEITYYRGFGEEGGLLLMRRAPFYNLEEPFEEGEELVLAENIRSLNFEYFDGLEWWEEWDPEEQESLPRAVRISIAVGREEDEQPRNFTIAAALPLGQKMEEEEEEEES